MSDEGPRTGRNETDQERQDRKWIDQLQELRVMQTGVQLLAGFLLILPFQDAFADLDGLQRALFLALVVVAALTTLCVFTPIAVHRHLSGRYVKHRVLTAGNVSLKAALVGVAVLVVGMVTLIFDVVVGRTAALTMMGVIAAGAVAALVVVPRALERGD